MVWCLRGLRVQLRDALAIAWMLGRMLVVPPMLCGLDRVWFPHAGRFPGSILALPFECPLDHVVRIEHVFRKAQNGLLPFKEHSFLANPALPEPPSDVNQVPLTFELVLEHLLSLCVAWRCVVRL
jgi:hypothetical protein